MAAPTEEATAADTPAAPARVRTVRRARFFAFSSLAVGLVLVALACSSGLSDLSGGGPSFDGGGTDSTFDSAPFADAGVPVVSQGLVLVHAAAFPPFRVCFDAHPEAQPLPDTDFMPSSNVPGIDVGSALPIKPTDQTLGRAYVFREATIRPSYPPGGGKGPTCGQLLGGTIGAQAIAVGDLGTIPDGIHLLVLSGCLGTADDATASTTRCGPNWTSASGNLSLDVVSVSPVQRTDLDHLPIQALQLSPSVDAVGRSVSLAYTTLDGGSTAPRVLVDDLPLGTPAPPAPTEVAITMNDLSSFASDVFTVALGAPRGATTSDAGAIEAGVLFTQSLADTQRISTPGALPPAFFGAGNTYLLVVLGDPDPRLGDGGTDDDARRKPHIIAIPLGQPPAQ
jgi:hypothetical protein